jgi:hypothetical protein
MTRKRVAMPSGWKLEAVSKLREVPRRGILAGDEAARPAHPRSGLEGPSQQSPRPKAPPPKGFSRQRLSGFVAPSVTARRGDAPSVAPRHPALGAKTGPHGISKPLLAFARDPRGWTNQSLGTTMHQRLRRSRGHARPYPSSRGGRRIVNNSLGGEPPVRSNRDRPDWRSKEP